MTAALQLATTRRGSGEPFVLVHPLGGDRHVWDPVVDLLAGEFACVAVDMPGFGESPQLPATVAARPAALAAAIDATLDGLGLAAAHVAGISLGGWVALELGKLPRVSSVTAICPAGLWPRPLGPRPSRARDAARALRPLLGLAVRSRRFRAAAFAGRAARPAELDPGVALQALRAWADAPGFDRANAAMRAEVFDGFEEIAAPVTLAWGELDGYVGPPRRDAPVARNVTLAGCAHIPVWDDPAAVAALLRSSAALAAAPAT
ncbi:MAG: alpha/beta fold hydrolase [Solirubrobacterales bacterium]|nr:alpha/beta fold hydrolase [Solirubrobacterales bacterium]